MIDIRIHCYAFLLFVQVLFHICLQIKEINSSTSIAGSSHVFHLYPIQSHSVVGPVGRNWGWSNTRT